MANKSMMLCRMFRLFNGFNVGAEGSLWKDLFTILFTVELLHDEARFIQWTCRVPLLTLAGLLMLNRTTSRNGK